MAPNAAGGANLGEFLGLVFIFTLLFIAGQATLLQVSPKAGAELSFLLSYPRYLMSNSSKDSSNAAGLLNNHHAITTDSLLAHLTILILCIFT